IISFRYEPKIKKEIMDKYLNVQNSKIEKNIQMIKSKTKDEEKSYIDKVIEDVFDKYPKYEYATMIENPNEFMLEIITNGMVEQKSLLKHHLLKTIPDIIDSLYYYQFEENRDINLYNISKENQTDIYLKSKY